MAPTCCGAVAGEAAPRCGRPRTPPHRGERRRTASVFRTLRPLRSLRRCVIAVARRLLPLRPMASPVTVVEPPMHVVGLAFASEPDAHHALHEAWRLHESHRLAVHDAVLVSAEHGEPEIVESLDPAPVAAAVPASLLGAIIGAVVAGPIGFLIGGAIAGATGAAVV